MDFEYDNIIKPPIVNRSTYNISTGTLNMITGDLYMDIYNYENLVIEVDNEFIPAGNNFAGLQVHRFNEHRQLFEYDNSGYIGTVPNIKLTKYGDVYTGYSSEDGLNWESVGYIYYPDVGYTTIVKTGVDPYQINKIKIYKSEIIYIYGLQVDWEVYFYEDNDVLLTKKSTGLFTTAQLPYYPYSGNVQVFDAEGTLRAEYNLNYVWGGDEYIVTSNVELRDLDNVSLYNPSKYNLGKLQQAREEHKYKIVNLDQDDPVTVTLQIASYSEFGDWVWLSFDYDNTPFEYIKSLTFTLNPAEEQYFWMLIQRPEEFLLGDFNYLRDDCSFFLEIV